MNVQDNEHESAPNVTSSEVNASDVAMEKESVKSSEGDASEVDSLIDYNLVEETPAEKAAKAKQKKADKEALRKMLANKGFAMRNLLRENHVKAHFTSPFSTEDQMSPEDILSEIPKEDLHEVGVVQRRMFMPASFVQKWIIPTIRARNALNGLGEKVPGGFETAMLFSIFDQSILDTTKPRQQLDEDASAIRAIVACAQDANIRLIEKMKSGNDGLKKIANAAIKQLEQATQLPAHAELYQMTEVDYKYHQERIADAIEQYRGHTERDLDDLQKLREQTALQASLIWEQQMQICKMNEAYLQLSDEKNRIVQADNRLVHDGMAHIKTLMSSLQDDLQKRHDVLIENVDRIDSPKIAESIRKLKTALQELHTRNAQLVMRNEKLSLQLSFVPPELWAVIESIERHNKHRYENQRTDPHYIDCSRGEYTFMPCEPGDIPVDRMQRCAAVTSVKELLLEVESVLEYLKCHDGIADPPDHLDEHIIEDATSIPMGTDANSTSAARAAASTMHGGFYMRGGIPSANPIDTPTVNATLAPRIRMVQNILDNEPPRPMHNTSAHVGHTVHPSKVQRLNPQVNLNTSSTAADPPNTFIGMSTYNAYVRDAPIGELDNPFAPLR